MTDQIQFEAVDFAVDTEQRLLTGVVIPFNAASRPARDPLTGKVGRYSFSAGTITLPYDVSDVRLNYGHDVSVPIGVARSLEEREDGIHGVFRVSPTPEGDRVLALAQDRALKAFSAGVAGQFGAPGPDGVQAAKQTALSEVSVVVTPAFEGAHITHVAASAAETEKADMNETPEVETAAVSLSADQVRDIVADEMAKVRVPVQAPQFEVNEEPIYRFAGSEGAPSGFDFATDLLAAAKDGDRAALDRLVTFTAENLRPQFLSTSDVASVSQATYRPDMFVGQAPTPKSPLYDTFYKGSLGSVQPFFWSKLDRANTTVSVHNHTEGVEPTPDNLVTATGATVTPEAISGKVHITREVADMGGDPNVSALIWNEFQRSMGIALENKTAGLITANIAAISALATVASGTSGLIAGQTVESGLVDIAFLPDGYRFTQGFGHVDLYKALATATNSDGEKMYPILAPTNRDGQVASKYARINVAGYDFFPTASLGASGAGVNYSLLADPNAIWVWNSGLQRLDKLQENVEGWDLGVFAYWAGIAYDLTGLRKIAYTK